MPSIGEKIRKLRKERGWTQSQLAKKVNRSPQVISNWERGYSSLDHEDIVELATTFDVSTDEIIGDNKIKSNQPYYTLTEKDERDIAKDLERMMNDLESKEGMAFYGEPLDEEDRELLKISLENSLRLARQMAKKKFTPKKYRN